MSLENTTHEPSSKIPRSHTPPCNQRMGADDSHVKQAYQPLIDHIIQEIPPEHQNPYPSPVLKLKDKIARLSRNILVAEFLIQEWVDRFKQLTKDEIKALARSFSFGNGLRRDAPNETLKKKKKCRTLEQVNIDFRVRDVDGVEATWRWQSD